tara:strand:+ start:294 stop:782 length:489 start_codon:yes stop_codon:yes gene_type:complete
MAGKNTSAEPIVIKKYANRRLYNTDTSSYVTLDDLCQMVKEGEDFAVYDAKSGDDLTRQILTQIIFEQESRGEHLLPISFLRNLISFYDDSIREFVPPYLENSMHTFMENQEKMREYMGVGSFTSPLKQMEEIGKQNMDMMNRAFQMFSPFANYDDSEESKQ